MGVKYIPSAVTDVRLATFKKNVVHIIEHNITHCHVSTRVKKFPN